MLGIIQRLDAYDQRITITNPVTQLPNTYGFLNAIRSNVHMASLRGSLARELNPNTLSLDQLLQTYLTSLPSHNKQVIGEFCLEGKDQVKVAEIFMHLSHQLF